MVTYEFCSAVEGYKTQNHCFYEGGGRTGHQHHGEEDDEQVGVVPKGEISLYTHVLR